MSFSLLSKLGGINDFSLVFYIRKKSDGIFEILKKA